MPSYTISIEKTETYVGAAGKEWKVVGQDGEKPVYGYTPEIEKKTTRTLKVYEQTVEDLDLPSIVAVVNGIGKA